jgi:prephenate dehydrogenase
MSERGQITIVGLGAIGASMGLAIREKASDVRIVGHDKDLGIANLAKRKGAVDKAEWNLIAACEDADLVILAIPSAEIPDTLRALAAHLKEGCVLTDTADVKMPVMGWAQEILSDAVDFVGGDPMVLSDARGLEGARADLFAGAWYCLTPSREAGERAVKLVADLVELLGARGYFVDPMEHDGLMAGVAHLPVVSSVILANTLGEEIQGKEMKWLREVALRGVPAPVYEEASSYTDLCLSNRENILRWLDAYVDRLDDFRQALAREDGERLAEIMGRTLEARESWEKESPEVKNPMDLVERSPWRLFLGGLAADRLSRAKDRGDKKRDR